MDRGLRKVEQPTTSSGAASPYVSRPYPYYCMKRRVGSSTHALTRLGSKSLLRFSQQSPYKEQKQTHVCRWSIAPRIIRSSAVSGRLRSSMAPLVGTTRPARNVVLRVPRHVG